MKNKIKKQHTKKSKCFVVRSLHIAREGREIVHNVSFTIRPGEIHVLMGPNGSGKSTLLNALMGEPRTEITKGTVALDGVSLTRLSPEKRSRKGLFLGFQHPVDIVGVTMASFLRTAKNAQAPSLRKEPMPPTAFAEYLKETLSRLCMDERFGGRQVNAGLSGGEKKRGELLQMVILEPRYALLDEFDSGLDVDSLREVVRIIATEAKKGRGFLLVSHNPSLHTLLPIDAVHVMANGRVCASGGTELLSKIAQKGFGI